MHSWADQSEQGGQHDLFLGRSSDLEVWTIAVLIEVENLRKGNWHVKERYRFTNKAFDSSKKSIDQGRQGKPS